MTVLRRDIRLLDAIMIVVSGVIGGGIFFTPSTVARGLPFESWIMAVWMAGALIAFAGALTFAELASRYPQAGGHYVYIREGFGGAWAFLYGWMLLLVIATGALASLALAFAGYLAAFVPLGPLAQKLIAADNHRRIDYHQFLRCEAGGTYDHRAHRDQGGRVRIVDRVRIDHAHRRHPGRERDGARANGR